MVKRTLEVIECDICNAEGERFLIQYPDGSFIIDRCTKHNTKIYKFRDEPGQWVQGGGAKRGFKLSTPGEIAAQRRNGD